MAEGGAGVGGGFTVFSSGLLSALVSKARPTADFPHLGDQAFAARNMHCMLEVRLFKIQGKAIFLHCRRRCHWTKGATAGAHVQEMREQLGRRLPVSTACPGSTSPVPSAPTS